MNRFFSKLRVRASVFVHDLVMIPIAWLGAYWLRFNLDAIPTDFWQKALTTAPVVLVVQGASFWYFGLYRGLWRFASVPDLIRIGKAVAVGAVLAVGVLFLTTRLDAIPRSVFALDALLLVFLLGGPRFVYRTFKDRHLYRTGTKKILIVGAGQAGEMLARDLIRNQQNQYLPAAFVDDDKRKWGKDLHGIPVLGGGENIPQLVPKLGIDLIVLAVTSASSREMQRLIGLCEQCHAPFRILPRIEQLVNGQINVKQLRDVNIEDLLGRESISLEWEAISAGIHAKTILVTGGGGSIGSELCRQIARLGPARLIVYEQSEFNLYQMEMELRLLAPQLQSIAVLGDVRDAGSVEEVFRRWQPQVVFHAAAYKHVPMLEYQARPAVTNNVFGTEVVASMADRFGAEAFVMVSTDKAVNPTNIMGTTKRVAELYCQTLNSHSRTRYITVRFGNVLGSSGSVIPLFQKQIAAGGPVTVTHPDITRYFMTIPEACQLILQASVIGDGGEIFVLDMGEPVKIAYLAEQLILLSGKRPGEDIEIVYTGLRPGEKLYEELFHPNEKLLPTRHPKIRQAISRVHHKPALDAAMARLADAVATSNDDALRAVLDELVPERGIPGQAFGANVVTLAPAHRS